MAIDYSKAKNKNTKFGGTDAIEVPKGTTAERSGTEVGQLRYNTDTGIMEQYNAAGWTGIDAPPVLSNVSPTSFDGSSGTVITLTGSNFKTGTTVKFITSGGIELSPGTTTFVSSTEITATIPRNILVSEEPLDVKVVNPSGLSALIETAIDAGDGPVWQTSAGTLATINDAGGSYSPIATVNATDADGQTVTYTINSGSVPAGTTFDGNAGTISGDPTNVGSQTTSTFTVRASDTIGNTSDRSFNIIVNPALDGTSSARAASSAQAIYDLDNSVTRGAYYINLPSVGVQQCYCEFINNEGWIVVANLKTAYFGDTNWTWNDITSWRRTGSSYGSVSNPYTGTAGQYRDSGAWNNYSGTRVGIMVHNNRNMFGSGSYVLWNLNSTHTNKTWYQLMQNNGGINATTITDSWYAQAGMATGGSIGATTGFATNLDYCPISRAVGPSGRLRVNRHLDNNGDRLITDYQVFESSNQDITRGIANHMAIPGGGVETTAINWNSICASYVNTPADGNTGSGNFTSSFKQFGSGTCPDSSNSSANGAQSPYGGPYYHYAILIK